MNLPELRRAMQESRGLLLEYLSSYRNLLLNSQNPDGNGHMDYMELMQQALIIWKIEFKRYNNYTTQYLEALRSGDAAVFVSSETEDISNANAASGLTALAKYEPEIPHLQH